MSPLPSASRPLTATLAPCPDGAALEAIDAQEGHEARVRVAAEQLVALGFPQVVITLRDRALHPTVSVQAGVAPDEGVAAPIQPLSPAVWRRYLPQLERFRVGGVYWLERRDPWVAREFFGEGAPRGGDVPDDLSGLVVGVLRGADRSLLGTVKMVAPGPGDPDPQALRAAGDVVRHLGARVAHDQLQALADRRQSRLHRLQEAGASLARSLDEEEILRDLARHVQRAVPADGVVVFAAELGAHTLDTLFRVCQGVERRAASVPLPEGIVAEVARTGHALRAGDREADRQRERAGLRPHLPAPELADVAAVGSVVAVPLRAGKRLVGVLVAHHAGPDMYGAEEEDVLATLAALAATAVTNARRYAESERERRTIEALADVARAVGESLRPGEVLRLILRHLVPLLGVQGACIALREHDYLNIVAGVGGAGVLAGVHLPLEGSLFGRVVRGHEQLLLNEGVADATGLAAVQRLAPVERLLAAPLITSRGAIGAIAAFNRDRPFADDDLRLLQRLADQVAVAIVNARLFDEVERATREWRMVFDASATGMVLLEDARTVRRCNSRAAALCGRPIAECLGRPLGALLEPAAPGAERILERLAEESSPGDGPRQATLRLAAGTELVVRITPLPGTGGMVTFDELPAGDRPAS